MSGIPVERRREILNSLSSTTCEGCGRAKDQGKSHCRSCYFKLPKDLRSRLYNGFGRGYEEAFEESLKKLASVARNEKGRE
jgi:hypothetical protein